MKPVYMAARRFDSYHTHTLSDRGRALLDFGAVESYDVIFKAPAYYAMKNGHKEILKIFYPEKYK